MNLHDEIAAIAYELCATRGCVPGQALDDWLNAERIVLAKHAGQAIEEPEEEYGSEETAAAEGEQSRGTEGTESEENQEIEFDRVA
jgi:Protein of unknown function (DUF2934)